MQTISKLDLAWEAVNALGGSTAANDPAEISYNRAIGHALVEIEALGGKDPAPARAKGKVTHTPGPWIANLITGSVKAGEKMVASVYGDHPACLPDDRMDANVRLIAAAPALLAVAKTLTQHITFDEEGDLTREEFDTVFALANAVIAEAEGAK